MNETETEIENLLQQLVAQGAGIFFVSATHTQPIAAAHLLPGGVLWYCSLWPENEFDQHFLEFAQIAEDQGNLNVFNFGQLNATVSPLDPDERTGAMWDKWTGDSASARDGRAYVALLETAALQKGKP
jgi:hypothetical protein